MTFADRTLGLAARIVANAKMLSTVDMSVQFIATAKVGTRLVGEPTVLKVTKNLAFTTGRFIANGEVVASANAVFRILER